MQFVEAAARFACVLVQVPIALCADLILLAVERLTPLREPLSPALALFVAGWLCTKCLLLVFGVGSTASVESASEQLYAAVVSDLPALVEVEVVLKYSILSGIQNCLLGVILLAFGFLVLVVRCISICFWLFVMSPPLVTAAVVTAIGLSCD